MVFYVLNCGVGCMRLLNKRANYGALERSFGETFELLGMRIRGGCVYGCACSFGAILGMVGVFQAVPNQ